MKTIEINWRTFNQILAENAGNALKFAYDQNEYVSSGYHITEIKRNVITSVDCGGVTNNWEEVVVQLWEPPQNKGIGYMKAEKALSIIELVERKLELDPLATVKIEYGNAEFDTRQLLPAGYEIENNALVIYLTAEATRCKAQQRDTNACCGTDGVLKHKLTLCC